MTPHNSLAEMMLFFLPTVPSCIVWLVGIGMALATWRRHPRVSQTALVACLLLLVSTAAGQVMQYWLNNQLIVRGWTFEEFRRFAWQLAILRVAFSTVGYVLLLFAVFGWRATPRLPVGPPAEPFAARTAVRPANAPGGETAIQPGEPRP